MSSPLGKPKTVRAGESPAASCGAADPELLVLSYEYGTDSGPEGICTQRLVDAIRSSGLGVAVRSSGPRAPGDSQYVRRFPSLFTRPTRVQKVIGRMTLGAPVSHWAWVRGASHPASAARAVYGRANPLSSLIAAARAARAARVPLWSHFSDPIPTPWDDPALFREAKAAVRALLTQSERLTFTTVEAIAFMERTYDLDLRSKAVLIRNIVPDWQGEPSEAERDSVVYAGNFGGRRTPDALVEGLAIANSRRQAPLRLVLVGTSARWVKSILARAAGRVPVQAVSRVRTVEPYYLRAHMVACVDADGPAVFLATKTGEAVHAARRVLLISPEASPASRRFGSRWASVERSSSDPEDVARAVAGLSAVDDARCAMELRMRRAALREFRADAVADVFRTAVWERAPYQLPRET